MVRQVEVTKHRRSNMANSTVNACAKKDGAGGSYTWGAAMQTSDYEPFGIDFESIGVTTSYVQNYSPVADQAPFDVGLDDTDAFPCLPSTKALEVGAPESAAPEEVEESDWVVVTPEADSSPPNPLHLVSKKKQSRRALREGGHKERPMSIDWSQAGIPQEVKMQILKSCMGPTHEGPYAKEHAASLPLDILRAQTVANKQRPNSVSRQKSVPRSGSRPRMIKQPNGKH
mmetsp:Transcript_19137/g.31103  ORF Transcript_19137/g.31103 Transcript_19137/m.31103 type:complete len:229 (+) Transcript_19137:90-776(+)